MALNTVSMKESNQKKTSPLNTLKKESQIQAELIKQLERSGWQVIKLIQTTANGIPDLMVLKNGRAVFIEVKRPGQYPRPLQLYRIEQLTNNGFEAIIARSVDDIRTLL